MLERIIELEKLLNTNCHKYDTDCAMCPYREECYEYLTLALEENRKLYITYEPPYEGQTFNSKALQELYELEVDKSEYKDFYEWMHDMTKTGIFKEL